jgi:hypothetical protein
MPTYERVANAGDVAGQNVYKVRFAGAPCSDVPQLQAWDDHLMTTTLVESLAGTVANGNKSLVAAASTSAGATGVNWVPGTAAPGGALTNRLRGNDSFCFLGSTAPAADEERRFQLAFGCASDSVPGASGHQPVLGVKVFYAGAPPTPQFSYNAGTEGVPVWTAMTSGVKGTAMAMGVRNTIHATGVSGASPSTSIAPVIKLGSGEKWAEEQWVLTNL